MKKNGKVVVFFIIGLIILFNLPDSSKELTVEELELSIKEKK